MSTSEADVCTSLHHRLQQFQNDLGLKLHTPQLIKGWVNQADCTPTPNSAIVKLSNNNSDSSFRSDGRHTASPFVEKKNSCWKGRLLRICTKTSSPSTALNEIKTRWHDGRCPRLCVFGAEAGGDVSLTLPSEGSAKERNAFVGLSHFYGFSLIAKTLFRVTNESDCWFTFLITWRMHPSFLQQGQTFASAWSIFWSRAHQ